ncbi:tetratricopeptide repeat protein [Micromonospora sp. NBS 11-29]|uniref:tetratricopeptide repeat protein n=1 Tax=Micromonospora sp. NBS 11-29 TaxID=1960879 RepID=UPI000B77DE04|nr:tetratricopeptide repeat protein [Micromonospora sp. NBS 11-29]
MAETPHRWIRAARYGDRRRLLTTGVDLPILADLDAHRRLRGPYTAVGTLVRAIVPTLLERRPELVTRHEIEILSVAHELRELVPANRETLTSLAVPTERTRFYSRMRTLRHAHGIVELLHAALPVLADGPSGSAAGSPNSTTGPWCLLVQNLHEADPTDQEFFAVLLRRADRRLLHLRLATASETVADPVGAVAVSLQPALHRYALPVENLAPEAAAADRIGVPVPAGADPTLLARAYVAADCVDDDPEVLRAYADTAPETRAAWHDERADQLATRNEWSLRLGAVPWHRERGSAPRVAGVEALREALEYGVNMGFYHATIDYGQRGRALVDWTEQLGQWWAFTTKSTTSLLALGRPMEALALYDEARRHTDNPTVHMQAAYATSMIYTRHVETGERDHRQARAWSNAAIAYARLMSDPRERAAHLVFNRNGLALVAMHEGQLEEALQLVTEGLADLDQTLGTDQHQLHRSVLRHNRSQLLSALGKPDEALVELDAVITNDPNYAEYHLDRGSLLRRLGRPEDALVSYERALRLSPPFPEVHYNRADTLLELGQVEAALAGFSYVLELDPQHLDARINRAGLRYALDDTEGAWADVHDGLAQHPGNAHLICVRGQLELADDPELARRTLSAALAEAPGLASAWAARGLAAHQAGDLVAAVADLGRAIELDDNPANRFNRGMTLLDAGRYDDALTDLTVAVRAEDEPLTRLHRGACLLALGRNTEADEEFRACLAADPELADEVREQRERLLPA